MREVRICDSCGQHNNLGSLFCENADCGDDISYLPPTILGGNRTNDQMEEGQFESQPVRTATKTIRMTGIRLVNTASGYEISIPLEGGIIGRSGTIQPDHFQNSQFVSNEHARIQLTATGYTIEDLDSTNGTKINGMKIPSGQQYPIPTGTRITVANLEYLVDNN
ncbi:FHA domain-containing protein [Ureibacillus xyleni]|uniref:FHA domain-containing protein n=1 Tax=Ureibacillus xyleni TaxID=614648 RepID=A0A285T3C9_9BACL|nr:FHA domain-containing protein [Ureibacillus xyleni]SOC15815.1 FHA domain-containing protein [Ureibacillus xyleni]